MDRPLFFVSMVPDKKDERFFYYANNDGTIAAGIIIIWPVSQSIPASLLVWPASLFNIGVCSLRCEGKHSHYSAPIILHKLQIGEGQKMQARGSACRICNTESRQRAVLDMGISWDVRSNRKSKRNYCRYCPNFSVHQCNEVLILRYEYFLLFISAHIFPCLPVLHP